MESRVVCLFFKHIMICFLYVENNWFLELCVHLFEESLSVYVNQLQHEYFLAYKIQFSFDLKLNIWFMA